MSTLIDESCTIQSNTQVGPGLHILQVRAPGIAQTLKPGQFVHLQIPGIEGHVLRRPFSIFDSHDDVLDILYQVVGFGTQAMTLLDEGQTVQMIGSIGHGWIMPQGAKRVLLVAGGVGAAPLFLFARQLNQAGVDVDVVLGAQTKESLVCFDRYVDEFGDSVTAATDDGSFGFAGFCTQPAQDLMDANDYDLVCCCGPEPLMRIVSGMAQKAGIDCQISLEKRMACGVGACLSCVVDTRDGKKRSCVDGPVFDASKVVW